MGVSGVIHFGGLRAGAIALLMEFRRDNPELRIYFTDDLSHASAYWNSDDDFTRLTQLAEALQAIAGKPK